MNILSAPLTDRFPSVDTPQAKKNKKVLCSSYVVCTKNISLVPGGHLGSLEVANGGR